MAAPPTPDAQTLERALRWLAPLERVFHVELSGLERIPRGPEPLMFVGNHQLLALDSPYLAAQVWRTYGVPLRVLADDFLFTVPPLARLMERLGMVRASRENAHALLQQGAWILVYPGGAREATNVDGGAYTLSWWGRLGFADVALEHGCTIVPVAARGIDSAFQVLVSSEQMLAVPPLRWLIDRLGVRREVLVPLAVPRRWPRLRFRLCEPVVLDHFMGHDPDTNRRRLRAEVAEAIERGLQEIAERSGHPAPRRGPWEGR